MVFCSGKVYFDLLKARRAAEAARRRAGAHRAALSVPGRGVRGGAAALSEGARGRLVPGGAAEPGRLVPDPPPARPADRGQARAATTRAARLRRRRPPASPRSTRPSSGAGRRGAAFERARESARETTRLSRRRHPPQRAAQEFLKVDPSDEHRDQSSPACPNPWPTRRWSPGARSPARPWRATRTSPTSRPTRSCSKCRRRRRRAEGNPESRPARR